MTDVRPEPDIKGEVKVEPAPPTSRSPGLLPPVASADVTEDAPLSIRRLATAPADPPPPSMSLQQREAIAKKRVGSTVKGWRLARLLGVGPVCAAYESFRGADDSGDHVVLKLMVGNIAQHERARAMFLRGAYASSRFAHPRVVSVSIDGTDTDGTPFVVRPWIDVEPLDVVVGRTETGMSEAQVLRIAEQVLDALEIAHAHGIVHGALTPKNVLITPRGSIRLCDFSVPPGHGPRTADEEDLLATRRVGPFSAPERCRSQPSPASEQSDIYMLAACMYFAVSREFPRGSSHAGAELSSTRARSIKKVIPKVSDGFAAILDHALSLEPEARYESAYAMLGDVRRVMAGKKPKLGDARQPVPSGSFAMMSQRDGAPSSMRFGAMPRSDHQPLSAYGRAPAPDQWKGNVALILAIALLVGVATFVMVREKVEEAREQEREELLKKQDDGASGQKAPKNEPQDRAPEAP